MFETLPLSEAEASFLKARLVLDAPRFDVRPLLEQLARLGYGREAVLFEGAGESGRAGIVSGLRFQDSPVRTAIISVHLGLMGDGGLLPSYFRRVAEDSERICETERSERQRRGERSAPLSFRDFIRFFDHQLINNLFRATHPEWSWGALCGSPAGGERSDDGAAFGDTNALLKSILRIVTPGSIATLHWIVQALFPELGVRVQRNFQQRFTRSYGLWAGVSRLDGEGILGREFMMTEAGYLIDLIAEDERDLSGREQADLARSRLDSRLLPLLQPFWLALTVRLIVLNHSSSAHVDDPHDPDPSFLGYNRLRPTGEVVHSTVLYRGVTGALTSTSEALMGEERG